MKSENAPKATLPPADPHCLIQAVADVMKEEPALEAVKIDRERRAISLATLGTPKRSDLEQVLTTQIRQIEQAPTGEHCDLLEGKKDCSTCTVPWASNERKNLTVRHEPNITTIARVTCPTAPTFWRWRDIPWPKLVPREVLLPEDDGHEDEWKAQLAAAGLCAGFGLAGHFAAGSSLSIFFYTLAYLAGGWFTAGEVWERLQKGALDVHFLMLAVAIGSAGIGAWSEGATLLFLFSFSGALEHYAMGRTHREIRSLFKTAPKVATLLDEQGNESTLPVEQLEIGMKLLVKPGEQFPVDAEIVKGRTASDESNLTGEAAPVEKGVGDSVLAGTLNLWGVVEVAVLKPAGQSALQKIIQLIREAQHLKAPSQRFTDRFGTHYTYAILGLSVVMFFVWWLGFGYPPFTSGVAGKSAFYRTMALLVVASPCALVLSIPSAVLAAIAWAARRGILFRGGAAVEKLAEINVVAMDKTGTLTTGDLMVERVGKFSARPEKEVAQLAYAMERLSTHPLARAITRFGKQRQLPILDLEQFESVNGLGLRARYRNNIVRLGRREWLEEDDSADASASKWRSKNAFLGGTGDPPVPSGDSPDGTTRASATGASPNEDRQVAEDFFLSLRGTSGERIEERGNLSKPASSPRPSPPSDGREGEVLARPHSEMRPFATHPDVPFPAFTSPIPVGESPTGIGGSPVPPIFPTGSEAPPTEAGLSEVWLASGALVGRILLRDDIRPKARDVVLQLRELGLQTVVLTGDRQATAQFLKNHLDLDDVRAGLKPEQKVQVIESFIQNHRRVAMIGDGVNDAPSLAAAHVGVAMGARGSDAALEQAEVVLMHDRLENFLTAFRLSQRARQIIRQNLVISLGTVAVLVVFALLGSIPLTVGVIGHEGSTVVVVLNSLRLLVGSPRS